MVWELLFQTNAPDFYDDQQGAACWPQLTDPLRDQGHDLDCSGLSIPGSTSKHLLFTVGHLGREPWAHPAPREPHVETLWSGPALGRQLHQRPPQIKSLDLLPNEANIWSRETKTGSKMTHSSNKGKPASHFQPSALRSVLLFFRICHLVNSTISRPRGCEKHYSVPSKRLDHTTVDYPCLLLFKRIP